MWEIEDTNRSLKTYDQNYQSETSNIVTLSSFIEMKKPNNLSKPLSF